MFTYRGRGLAMVAILLCLVLFITSTSWMYNPLDAKGVYKARQHDNYMEASGEYFATKPTMVVMTVQRKEPYIQAFLWSFLAFNADPRPHLFIINREDSDLPKEVYAMSEITVRNATPFTATEYPQWKRALYLDHIDALDICLEEDRPWCLVFEGDTLLTVNFMDKFMRFVSHEKNVAMVKLFVSDHWSGWSAADTPLFVFVVLAVAVSVAFYLRRRAPLLSWKERYSYGIVAGLLVICILLVVSKQTFDRILFIGSDVKLVPTTVEASSVATAYPRESVKPLRDHLQAYINRESDPQGLDLEQYEWARGHGRVLRTYPSLVQHIGVYSSAKLKNQGDFLQVKQDSTFIGPLYP